MSTSAAGGANRATRRHPTPTPPLIRRWASLVETADYLHVTERTVRTMISDGRLTGYRNKSFIRLDLNEVDAAMQPFGGSVSA